MRMSTSMGSINEKIRQIRHPFQRDLWRSKRAPSKKSTKWKKINPLNKIWRLRTRSYNIRFQLSKISWPRRIRSRHLLRIISMSARCRWLKATVNLRNNSSSCLKWELIPVMRHISTLVLLSPRSQARERRESSAKSLWVHPMLSPKTGAPQSEAWQLAVSQRVRPLRLRRTFIILRVSLILLLSAPTKTCHPKDIFRAPQTSRNLTSLV